MHEKLSGSKPQVTRKGGIPTCGKNVLIGFECLILYGQCIPQLFFLLWGICLNNLYSNLVATQKGSVSAYSEYTYFHGFHDIGFEIHFIDSFNHSLFQPQFQLLQIV